MLLESIETDFKVGDLIIHKNRDELAIVVGIKGGNLEVITILLTQEPGFLKSYFDHKMERVSFVWDLFTEETEFIYR